MPAILSKTLFIAVTTASAAALTLATGGTAGVAFGIAALVAVVGEAFYDNIIKAAGSILRVVVEKLQIMTTNTEPKRIQQWLELAGTAIMTVQQKLYKMEHGHSYVKNAVKRGVAFFCAAIKAITNKIFPNDGSSGTDGNQPWERIDEEAINQLGECLPPSEFAYLRDDGTDVISSEVDPQARIEELEQQNSELRNDVAWYQSLGLVMRRSTSPVAI